MRFSTVDVAYLNHTFTLEYQWLNDSAPADAPILLFLHEGLGCITMWKDFPQQLCAQGNYRGLVFSRAGYGHSTPLSPEIRWPVDYLQQQAEHAVPALLEALGLNTPEVWSRLWLIGHSDGGSIALLYAALYPQRLAGAVVMAPHIFVEDITLAGIEDAKRLYEASDQWRTRLARHHSNPDSAFYGWNNAWRNPDFRHWNIEHLLPRIECPLLAIQGENDEYATLAQINDIQKHAPHTQLLAIPDCGHSPQLQKGDVVIEAVARFI